MPQDDGVIARLRAVLPESAKADLDAMLKEADEQGISIDRLRITTAMLKANMAPINAPDNVDPARLYEALLTITNPCDPEQAAAARRRATSVPRLLPRIFTRSSKDARTFTLQGKDAPTTAHAPAEPLGDAYSGNAQPRVLGTGQLDQSAPSPRPASPEGVTAALAPPYPAPASGKPPAEPFHPLPAIIVPNSNARWIGADVPAWPGGR